MKIISSYILIIFLFLSEGYSQVIKFEETFDSLDVESRGWILLNNDGSMDDYPAFTEAFTFTNTGLLSPQKGRYFIHYDALNANDNGLIDQWIITPQFTNIEKFDKFSFWCGAVDNEYKDSLRVLVSTSGSAVSDFAELDRFKASGPSGTWHEKSYDLSAYAGKNIYVAVNYLMKDAGVLGANSDNVWIDHFTVESGFGPDIQVNNFELLQNYPNPFNPSTEIVFSIPENANVSIKIFDIAGREVQQLVKGIYSSGRYGVSWNAAGFSSGTYFYTISVTSVANGGANYSDTKQMIFIK
jgi:hypothetical protein